MAFGKMGARGRFGTLGALGTVGIPLSYPQPYAQIGDSIIWAQSNPVNNSICQIGQWLNGFSSGRNKLVQNFNKGNGGDLIAAIAGRYTTDLSPLAVKIVLANGCINDLLAGTSATTIMLSWDSIISQAAALGHYLIILPPLPTSSLTGPQETQRQAVVTALNARASRTVRVIDITGYDYTTMDYAQQGTGVRIHPNIVGAQWIAQKAATILATIVRSGTGLLSASDPLNKVTNGYLTGTAGSLGGLATGTLADNLTVGTNTAKGNMTLAVSKTARAAGGSWQQCVYGGTYISGSNDLYVLSGNTLSGFAANDKLVMSMDFEVDSGAVNIDGINVFGLLFEVGFASNTTTVVFYVNTTEHQGGYGTPTTRYILQSEPFNLAVGKVPGILNMFIAPNLNQDAAGGSACAATFRFGSLGISKYS